MLGALSDETDPDYFICSLPEQAIQQLVAQTPLGRLGEPGDIADVVLFLASEEARWINGQNIQVNGGIF